MFEMAIRVKININVLKYNENTITGILLSNCKDNSIMSFLGSFFVLFYSFPFTIWTLTGKGLRKTSLSNNLSFWHICHAIQSHVARLDGWHSANHQSEDALKFYIEIA